MQTNDQRRYLIEASGRDALGTSFQFFDGAQGWNPAAQAVSEMFKRVPSPADFKVYQLDLVDGHLKDVTKDMLDIAEVAFHAARKDRRGARRSVSSYAGETAA